MLRRHTLDDALWAATVERYPFTQSLDDADRARLRYRFRGRDPAKGWQENEHTAYATVVDGRVTALNLTCAGFRPAEPTG